MCAVFKKSKSSDTQLRHCHHSERNTKYKSVSNIAFKLYYYNVYTHTYNIYIYVKRKRRLVYLHTYTIYII